MAHPITTLSLSRRPKYVITFAKSVASSMTNNASFPSPTPPLATFQADIAALDAAEALVLNRTKGAAQSRDVHLDTVRSDLEHLRAYVQQVADANPSTASAIIQSAGMNVRKVTQRTKGDLVARQGIVSGSAHLIAKAAASRASYEWQYSLDQKTWANAPSTLQANTDVGALTTGSTYFFRVRPITKGGEGNWTQVVSLVVT